MRRFYYSFLFILALSSSAFAQRLSKELQTRTWYCSCNFSADSLVLSRNNTEKFEWEASFSPTGKVTFRNLKKNITVSHYSYSLKKRSLRLYFDLKDSLANLNYTIGMKEDDGSFKLKTFYTMRYLKKNKNDIPPSDHFTLVNGDKKKTFYNLTDLTIYRMKKGLKHDSIEYISKGEFLELRSDTILLNAYQYSEHNFYKRYPDSLHYFSEFLFDSLVQIKIPVKEITKIQSHRERFTAIVNGVAIAALATFVVSLPLALIIQKDPANTIFTTGAVYSALSIPVIVSFNIIFSKQKFQIVPLPKKTNTWKFETNQPGIK